MKQINIYLILYINLLCFYRGVPYLLVYIDFSHDFLFLTLWTIVLKEKKTWLKLKLAKEPIID